MTIITYSLKAGEKRSDQFYSDLAEFTDAVILAGEGDLSELLSSFEAEFPDQNTRAELIFDLLVLGVLWREYGQEAGELSTLGQRVLSKLVTIRRKVPVFKPVADFLRGVLGWAFGIGRDGYNGGIDLTLDTLASLVDWLEAAGEFKEEVCRIKLWQGFFSQREQADEDLINVNGFAAWFYQASQEALGEYTPNVEQFLAEKHSRYRGREDYVFTGRQREAYHLYMVGVEIMNRSYREAFVRTEKRIMFVPPCMAAPQDGKCQAVDTPLGERCANCTPSCQVNQITRLGEKHDIEVFMIPDSFSPLNSGKSSGMGSKPVGVIGVSCPVTITGGGWEMKRLGIPAQGLLLDHCGCSWHWDPGKGVVTEINFRQLKEILGENSGNE